VTVTASPAGASVGSIDLQQVHQLDLAEVVAHPANPRGLVVAGDEGLAELVESIRSMGVLEAALVVPSGAAVAAWAELDDATAEQLANGAGRPWAEGVPAGARWVLVAGHRRAEASRLAGLDRLPAVVREDLAADPAGQVAAMAAENIARRDLAPLDEARSFSALAALGWSQRRIAAAAGCSPGQVAKRLSLLRLPAPIADAVRAGNLSVADALEFTALDTANATGAWKAYKDRSDYQASSPKAAVDITRRRAEWVAAASKAEQDLAEQGVPVVNPDKRFGSARWQHQIDDAKAIKQARKAGTLVASITGRGDVVYYTTAKPARTRSAHEEAEATTRRERTKAMKARAVVCARIAQAGPPVHPGGRARALLDSFAQALLHSPAADVSQLAWTWTHPDQGGPGHSQHRDWIRGLVAGAGDDAVQARIHAAHAVALAQDEIQARWQYSGWGQRTIAYLDRLQAAGYTPTPWETARLDSARATAEAPVDQTEYPTDPSRYELSYSCLDGWIILQLGNSQFEDRLLDRDADLERDDLDAAHAWATETLRARGVPVHAWQAITHDDLIAWKPYPTSVPQ
jgi:ParB family chromosome partitioning protein